VYTEEDAVATTQGCDYSFARPDPKCLYQSGIRFAVRYTSIGQSGKNMTPEEVRGLVAAGLAVVTVFEETAGHMFGGHAAGVAAAHASVDLASRCGMPPDRPHYYALDIDPNHLSVQQWRAVMDYLDGAASVHGKDATGVYAGYRGIEELVPGWAPWGWQTYAWSGGRWSAKARLQQYRNGVQRCGGTIDLCQALAGDYGQWGLEEEPLKLDAEDRQFVEDILERIALVIMAKKPNTVYNAESHPDLFELPTVKDLLQGGFGGFVPGSADQKVRPSQEYLFKQVAGHGTRLAELATEVGTLAKAGEQLAILFGRLEESNQQIIELLSRVTGSDPDSFAKALLDLVHARTAPPPPG
jgi:hypothetical protein